jgi:uncharacterized repeat protein (TIGR03803 family)
MKSIRLCAASVMAVCAIAILAAQSAQAQTLYSFKGQPDGANPVAGVTQDAEGNLYGTTDAGGTSNVGTVFKLSKAGKETVLHSFKGGADDGAVPLAGVMLDAKGNLFGTTAAGGDLSCPVQEDKGCGVVFQLSPTGKFTVLYRFTGGADGAIPHSGVIQDTDGNLYGTTEAGGENCDDLTGAGPGFHHIQKRVPCPSRVFCERAGLLDDIGWRPKAEEENWSWVPRSLRFFRKGLVFASRRRSQAHPHQVKTEGRDSHFETSSAARPLSP